ncbi:2-keto-3-deoxygluconate permease [Clostridium ragsdalei P11]|uniref:2-keto-3-deoxygluconate permease n=1 Tax=Clostridium ragsdalei P11 TaxID=1353534 RepID=A0A1A6AQI6_9CLOT|nr:2-keto-3-deoxygluconate permease [Clostridium ragsdalei]OBR92341.1 2-keto-3-deoxygluconate permease [Clostridium ragsdalei P11]
MKIMKTVQKVPGGMMVVPLLIGAIINTVAPHALKIGSFTTAVFSSAGVASFVGLQTFFVGTNLKFKEAPEALRRGSVLLVAKYLAGLILAIITNKIFGLSGFLGISVLAIICSVTGSNGSLYLSLMGTYGDSKDTAAQGILNIHDGPFLALITLGASGLASIPLLSLLAAIVPLLVGCILGNADKDLRDFFSPGASIVIPFVGFTIGAGINFSLIIKAGLSGILVGLLVFFVGGGLSILADRYINKRPGYAGAAIASAAGNTIASPAAIAIIDPKYKPFVASATTQIAAAVVLTVIIVPPLVAWMAKRYGCPKFDEQKAKNASLQES